MRLIKLAIHIIAHGTKRSASSLLQTNPQPINLNGPPDIDMDQKETSIALPADTVQANCEMKNEQITKALFPVLPWELNDPKRNVDRRVDARGRMLQSSNWTQLGLDIDGEAADDWSGWSVSLSSNGTVLAVGAPFNDPSDRIYAGHVRVYNFNGSGWTQLGLDIDGEAAGDWSGYSVSLSSNGTVLAVGAPFNDPSGRIDAGHVRVYNFNGSGWTQLGLDIDGEAANDESGYSVSLSSNGTVLAVGAPYNNPSGRTNAGQVRVYNFNGSGWTQLGLDIDGEAAGDWSGWSVSLSSNGTVLAVGAPYYDPSGHPDAGHVRVYNFTGSGWTQLGLDIDGEAAYDYSGHSVSLSSNGTVLAVGAPYYDPSSGENAGHVRVYNFNGSGWTQLGQDIDGEAAADLSGYSVSLSSNGTVLAVGTPYNDPSGRPYAGHVRVYNFNGSGWIQLGLDIDGEAADDWSGWSVSLSSIGTVLAVGALYNDPSARIDAGHVRVYENDFLSIHSSPSSTPSKTPSASPTLSPSKPPSSSPSFKPSIQPSSQPSSRPSQNPSIEPSSEPSSQPSSYPSGNPSSEPSSSSSADPSSQPSSQPSFHPSAFPTVLPTDPPTSHPLSKSGKASKTYPMSTSKPTRASKSVKRA